MFSEWIDASITMKLKRFVCERTGSVALGFGIAFMSITAAVGVALDYSKASNAQTQFKAIIDAAALSGVRTPTVLKTVGSPTQKDAVIAIVRADLAAQIGTKPDLKAMLRSTTVEGTIADNQLTVKICYWAEAATAFMGFIGIKAVKLQSCAQAATALPTYVSIHALVDASGSMGIGASVADQALMQKEFGCAFACHTINWGQPTYSPRCERGYWFSMTTACAKRVGARTRFDVVRNTLIDMVEEAQAATHWPGQFKFSVHKFSNTATLVHATSGDLASVKRAVQVMMPDVDGAGTNLRYALQQIRTRIPAGGDGRSPTTPKVYLIILSDGVEGNVDEQCTVERNISTCRYWGTSIPDANFTLNHPGFYEGVERTQVIDSAPCTPFKTNGVNVMTLHTEYATPPNTTDSRFRTIRTVLGPVIKSRMQECASSRDMAYSATTPAEIQAAMDRMFKSITLRARLTQ